MSVAIRTVAILLSVSSVIWLGCESSTRVEKLQVSFDEMKSATNEFHQVLQKIHDEQSAEELLPEVIESHKRLATSVHALDEMVTTSSRKSTKLKAEIAKYKLHQKPTLKKEFERLKKDDKVKAILEPFMTRINAF